MPTIKYYVKYDGTSSPYYYFRETSSGNNLSHPLILYKGYTYVFESIDVPSGHPFSIGETHGSNYNSIGNIQSSGSTITFTISNTTTALKYYCVNHSNMIGNITVSDPPPDYSDGNPTTITGTTSIELSNELGQVQLETAQNGSYDMFDYVTFKIPMYKQISDLRLIEFDTNVSTSSISLTVNRGQYYDQNTIINSNPLVNINDLDSNIFKNNEIIGGGSGGSSTFDTDGTFYTIAILVY
jgi:hypothetical protein